MKFIEGKLYTIEYKEILHIDAGAIGFTCYAVARDDEPYYKRMQKIISPKNNCGFTDVVMFLGHHNMSRAPKSYSFAEQHPIFQLKKQNVYFEFYGTRGFPKNSHLPAFFTEIV